MTFPATRDEFPAFFAQHCVTGIGAEIGTYQGEFAETILTGYPGQLDCVDPYVHQPGWEDILNHRQHEYNEVRDAAIERLFPWITQGRCFLHRTTSLEAASQGWAKDLDFVYLDARHDYESVAADLAAWAPRIRSGGWFAGHDYLDGTCQNTGTVFGVKEAVLDWVSRCDRIEKPSTLYVTGETYPSWLIQLS